jgi:spermidine/putrescine ABC transporter ATP-binding subunit
MDMPDTSPALIIRNISKTFGPVTALEKVSLEVHDSEFVSLLGPSGCGKTTLLRIVAGFETPDAGEVIVDGRNILAAPPNRRPMNMVFQRYALFPHMTVYENIAFSQLLKRRPKEEIDRKVMRMLELVQLEGYESRKPEQLSGGQCQRIALARALINEPRVLLLDEPLGALDLKIRKQMQIELKDLQEKLKTTFIYVTHDQEEALVMSDRIVLMNAGKTVQIDTPKGIYDHPNSRFSATFIGESNVLEGKVSRVESDRMIVNADGMDVVCNRTADFSPGDEVVLAIRLEKVKKLSHAQAPSLENQFTGAVEDVVFFGYIVKYYVRISKRIRVIAQKEVTEEESSVGMTGGDVGRTITVGFSRRDVNLFPL